MTVSLAREDIKRIAGFLGLSMQELASKVGVSRGFLTEVGAGRENFTDDLNNKLCKVLFDAVKEDIRQNNVYGRCEVMPLSQRICQTYIQALNTEQVLSSEFLNNIFDKFSKDDFSVLSARARKYKFNNKGKFSSDNTEIV